MTTHATLPAYTGGVVGVTAESTLNTRAGLCLQMTTRATLPAYTGGVVGYGRVNTEYSCWLVFTDDHPCYSPAYTGGVVGVTAESTLNTRTGLCLHISLY